MACIRALVMSAYKAIDCLISQQKHMLWVLKRTVAMRWFFLAQNYRLNLMCKKILTILRSTSVFISTMIYTVCRYDTPQCTSHTG